jgi:hypothetical protein
MNSRNKIAILTPIFLLIITALFISGCEKSAVEPNNMTDNEYVQSVVSGGYDNDYTNEDNIMMQEYNDLNEGTAVFDNETNPPANLYDSLFKWGRKITGVNRNYDITNEGDSIKNVVITTTFTGNFIIIGYQGGVKDTAIKPYTEVLKRNVAFKRVANTEFPRRNWRLYKISVLDGETTQPQLGSSKVQITKVEIYKNNSGTPTYTFNGPDFTNTVFMTKLFGGTGIPEIDRNDLVKVKIYTTSQLADVDYVAFHWAKNTFGFHRIPFALESETGSGPYYRIYSKDFNIYGNHRIGAFNAFFSANTRESLYENDINKFASDFVGIPFKVTR